MNIDQNISLADKNMLRLDARAEWYFEALTEDALLEAAAFALQHKLRVITLGEGSNIVLAGNLAGLVVKNQILGVTREGETVHAAGGENWHELVRSTITSGLYGLENLASIPGTVGAAPVQNIGAYGVELSDRLISLKAIHLPTLQQRTFSKAECELDYRDSLFKRNDEWLITEVSLALSKVSECVSTYPGIDSYLRENRLDISGETIAEAVSHIRAEKLPDPSQVPNVGSFFKNPVLATEQAIAFAKAFPDLVQFDAAGGKKLSAAQLIELAGLKGFRVGQFAVSDKHALVITHKGDGAQAELFELIGAIRRKVKHTFGIVLEIEPRIYPDGVELSY